MFMLPIYALAWTGVVVILGFWMMLIYRSSAKVWEQLFRSTIAEQFPWHTLSDGSLRTTVQKRHWRHCIRTARGRCTGT